MRMSDPIRTWIETTPDAPAVSDLTQTLTYGAFGARIAHLADHFQSLGIGPGDRLMIVGENSVALATAILATARIGAVAVLENARRAPKEVEAILAHCRPRRALFVFADSKDAEAHAAGAGADVLDHPDLGRFGLTQPDPTGTLASAEAQPEGVAAFIYTTGTTGTPKGVMLTHANLDFIARNMTALRHMSNRDKVYCVLPISHVMGLASVLLGTLRSGAHLYLRARFSAGRCLSELNALGITALQGATAMFAKLNEEAERASWRAAQPLRFMGAGGAPIDPTVKRQSEEIFGTALHNGYGLTEAASLCWTRFEEDNADDTVGRPLPGVELKVCDADGRSLPEGEVGELWAHGPNVMAGYFLSPEQTAKVLKDGWLNTQDLARIAPDGRVYIVGRAKDVIIRSGFKVNPLEVETALNRHPAIAHSAVVGREACGNEDVVAFVELRDPLGGLPQDLPEHLKAWLSPYKHPSEIVVLDALPLAQNGKVLKRQLIDLANRPGERYP